MHALTVRQPWAEAIARHGKTVENRTRRPPAGLLGQRIAIHVSRSCDGDLDGWDFWRDAAQETIGGIHCHIKAPHLRPLLDWVRGQGDDVPNAGRVIATARLHGVVGSTRVGFDNGDRLLRDALTSPWFTGPVGWVLADVRALQWPVGLYGSCNRPRGINGGHMMLEHQAIRGHVYPFELSPDVAAAVLAAEVQS